MNNTMPLRRFQELLREAQTVGDIGNLTEKGVRSAVKDFEAAIPTARAIGAFGNALESHGELIEPYLRQSVQAMERYDTNDDDPEWRAGEEAGQRETAMYFLGLALGLLLADRV